MLYKPQLIVVTGRPGAGKTTFAKALSQTIHFPLVSRDEIKEGFLQTVHLSHDSAASSEQNEMARQVNAACSGKFMFLVKKYLEAGVSLVAEAAFQPHVWEDYLIEEIGDLADITVIICRKNGLSLPDYKEPELPYKTLFADTTGEYCPSLQEFLELLLPERQF